MSLESFTNNMSNSMKIFLFLFFFAFSSLHAENETTTVQAVGTVYPRYTCILSSQVAGRVEEVYVDVGDQVKKGAPLVKLDPIFFKINVFAKEAVLSACQIDLRDSKVQLERMKKLWQKPEGETPSISQKRFDDAKTTYEKAIVSVKQAEAGLKKAQVELDEAVIKAPFDGVITERLVDPGVTIAAGPQTKLLELQSHDFLYVEFPITYRDLCHVQEGNQVFLEAEEKMTAAHTIDRIYPHIDPETRTITCRVTVCDDALKLRPGALVKVRVLPAPMAVSEEEQKEVQREGEVT